MYSFTLPHTPLYPETDMLLEFSVSTKNSSRSVLAELLCHVLAYINKGWQEEAGKSKGKEVRRERKKLRI